MMYMDANQLPVHENFTQEVPDAAETVSAGFQRRFR
jgi:hypothetical protein